ncbi:hypothetical protein TU94_12805 [Streptomyces cyaneogriseus subsp. noncyanogenus]|uniref:Uncharacterized protein n=1 Tax=Streptomyces cyaneogriseus subsp. noncyanogenus TaxID=477245 RepID=A0A0C5GD80_9ACTN|nr:hypothetical protein TU94_12805 [Streptomyces cyaneogriseus subsp. noncyanogenus]
MAGKSTSSNRTTSPRPNSRSSSRAGRSSASPEDVRRPAARTSRPISAAVFQNSGRPSPRARSPGTAEGSPDARAAMANRTSVSSDGPDRTAPPAVLPVLARSSALPVLPVPALLPMLPVLAVLATPALAAVPVGPSYIVLPRTRVRAPAPGTARHPPGAPGSPSTRKTTRRH